VNFNGVLREGEREHALAVSLKDGVLRGTRDGAPFPDLAVERRGAEILLGTGRGAERAVVARDGDRILVHLRGRVHEFVLPGTDDRRREKAGRRSHGADAAFAASPMTGTVVQVAVKEGDAVPAGGTLAVVEAMKMQFVVRAPRAVVVKSVKALAGKPVEIGGVLVEFAE
jgi:biotin carboxyl carrier protein